MLSTGFILIQLTEIWKIKMKIFIFLMQTISTKKMKTVVRIIVRIKKGSLLSWEWFCIILTGK